MLKDVITDILFQIVYTQPLRNKMLFLNSSYIILYYLF